MISIFWLGNTLSTAYPSTTVPQALLDLTAKGYVGGVILFGANFDSTTQAQLQKLKDAYASSPAPALLKKQTGYTVPFFITTDQEGGEVRRINPGAPEQSAKEVGESSNPAALGQQTGSDCADTLTQWLHNVNLAPVLDVYRTAGDFEDYYERSYGNTSAAVIAPAIPFIQAMQAKGVAATAKHFPGLGAASHTQNTDEEPVTLNLTLNQIRTIDEGPYVAAIKAGVDLIMASWAIYPAMDTLPSGLSSKWITSELRGRLGYTGVTITDAIGAGAVSHFGLSSTSTMAFNAGMDLLLSTQQSQGETVRTALFNGVKGGSISQTSFDASTARVAKMRSKLNA